MPFFGLVQERQWLRSSIWISSVAGICKILCQSEDPLNDKGGGGVKILTGGGLRKFVYFKPKRRGAPKN